MRNWKERRQAKVRLVLVAIGTIIVWICLVVFGFAVEIYGYNWLVLRLVPAFMIISFIGWVGPLIAIIFQNSLQGLFSWLTYELLRNSPVLLLVYLTHTTLMFKIGLFICALATMHQIAFIWNDIGFLRSNERYFWVWRMKAIARRGGRELPISLVQYIVQEISNLATPQARTSELKLSYFETALREYLAGRPISDESPQLEQTIYRTIADGYAKQ